MKTEQRTLDLLSVFFAEFASVIRHDTMAQTA